MRNLIRLTLGLVIVSASVTTLQAAGTAKKPATAVLSASHPKDSQGETVYVVQQPSDSPSAALAGTFVPAEALAAYKSTVGEHAQFNFGGLVEVEGIVTATGDVIDVQLAKGDPNSNLARKALAALSQSKFKPATLEGKPVAMLLQVKFRYGLLNSM